MTTKAKILQAATEEARERGYQRITRDGVAVRAMVSNGSINYYFETIERLRAAVLEAAVENSDLAIIAQGLATGAPEVARVDDETRQRAVQALA